MAASKVESTALKVQTPMRSTALIARSRGVPVDSWPDSTPQTVGFAGSGTPAPGAAGGWKSIMLKGEKGGIGEQS